MKHAHVIGAGISGVTTAYYLAEAGYNVTVYDEREYPAMATSYPNGGQLSASNAETWNSWSNVAKGAKWLFKKDAPLKINLTPSLHKYGWFMQFLQAIPHRDANTVKTCKMALQAHDLYKAIADHTGTEFDRVDKGILHVYTDPKELHQARQTNLLYKQAGLERWEVTADEVRSIEPALDNPDIIGGFYNTQDYTGDIHKFTVNLMDWLMQNRSVFYKQYQVEDLHDFMRIRPGITVLCAGVNSRKLSRDVGDTLHIYPVKGYSITIHAPGDAPWTSLLDDSAKIVTARLGKDRLRIAGTAEFTGYNTDIKQARIRPLKQWARSMIPGINLESITPWAGLRPMTPNMMPIVRKSKVVPDLYYNTGHGHLGWTLGAYTAKHIADLVNT